MKSHLLYLFPFCLLSLVVNVLGGDITISRFTITAAIDLDISSKISFSVNDTGFSAKCSTGLQMFPIADPGPNKTIGGVYRYYNVNPWPQETYIACSRDTFGFYFTNATRTEAVLHITHSASFKNGADPATKRSVSLGLPDINSWNHETYSLKYDTLWLDLSNRLPRTQTEPAPAGWKGDPVSDVQRRRFQPRSRNINDGA